MHDRSWWHAIYELLQRCVQCARSNFTKCALDKLTETGLSHFRVLWCVSRGEPTWKKAHKVTNHRSPEWQFISRWEGTGHLTLPSAPLPLLFKSCSWFHSTNQLFSAGDDCGLTFAVSKGKHSAPPPFSCPRISKVFALSPVSLSLSLSLSFSLSLSLTLSSCPAVESTISTLRPSSFQFNCAENVNALNVSPSAC